MSDEQQQIANPDAPEVSLRGRRIRNPKLRRGIFLLPSLFTTGNLVCGYYACVATLLGTAQAGDPFDRAAKAIGLAMVFDSLDVFARCHGGSIADKRQTKQYHDERRISIRTREPR